MIITIPRWLPLAATLFASPSMAAMGLVEAYQLAQQNDPVLRAAAADLAAVTENRQQSRASLLPNASLNASATRNHQRTDTSSPFSSGGSAGFGSSAWALNLSQPLYRKDRWLAVEQADLRIRQAEASYAATGQDLMLRVATAYTDVLAAGDTLRFAEAELEAIDRQREQTQQRFEVGLVAITGVNEAQAAYDLAVARKIEAANALDIANEAMREIIGQYPAALSALGQALPLVSPDPQSADAWVDTALEQNLNLRAARVATEVARQEVQRKQAGHHPTLDLVVNHRHSYSGGINGSSESDTSSIGLEFNLPLYSGGATSSGVKEAEYRVDQSLEQQEQSRRAVERQTRSAYLGVMSAMSRVKALKQALLSSQSALDAVNAGLDVGTRTIVDVLDAQRDVFSASRDLARARYDYLLNHLRLKQAAGTLSEEALVAFDGYLLN